MSYSKEDLFLLKFINKDILYLIKSIYDTIESRNLAASSHWNHEITFSISNEQIESMIFYLYNYKSQPIEEVKKQLVNIKKWLHNITNYYDDIYIDIKDSKRIDKELYLYDYDLDNFQYDSGIPNIEFENNDNDNDNKLKLINIFNKLFRNNINILPILNDVILSLINLKIFMYVSKFDNPINEVSKLLLRLKNEEIIKIFTVFQITQKELDIILKNKTIVNYTNNIQKIKNYKQISNCFTDIYKLLNYYLADNLICKKISELLEIKDTKLLLKDSMMKINKLTFDKYFNNLEFKIKIDNLNTINYKYYYLILLCAIIYTIVDKLLFYHEKSLSGKRDRIFLLSFHGDDVKIDAHEKDIKRVDLDKLMYKYGESVEDDHPFIETPNIKVLNLQSYGRLGSMKHDLKIIKLINDEDFKSLIVKQKNNITDMQKINKYFIDNIENVETNYETNSDIISDWPIMINYYPNPILEKKGGINGPRNFLLSTDNNGNIGENTLKTLFDGTTFGIIEIPILNSIANTILKETYDRLKKTHNEPCRYDVDCLSGKCTNLKCDKINVLLQLELNILLNLKDLFIKNKQILLNKELGLLDKLQNTKLLKFIEKTDMFKYNNILNDVLRRKRFYKFIVDKLKIPSFTDIYSISEKILSKTKEFVNNNFSLEKTFGYNDDFFKISYDTISLEECIELVLQNSNIQKNDNIIFINGTCRWPSKEEANTESFNILSSNISESKRNQIKIQREYSYNHDYLNNPHNLQGGVIKKSKTKKKRKTKQKKKTKKKGNKK